MNIKFNRKTVIIWILLLAVSIVVTRGVTLSFNLQLHPDEHVFYLSANSLLNSILHPDVVYEANKPYPEGAYLFHAVFQFAGKVFSVLTHQDVSLQVWGRISSVFYFTAAVLLGLRLIYQYLGKSSISLFLYGLTMCFSLFFIEQSRYGTGDMISLMLLMLLLNITAHASAPNVGKGWWAAAFFVCGILGAVKYPLLFFLLIPVSAFLYQNIRQAVPCWLRLIGLLVVAAAAFILFSPSMLQDPSYPLQVIQIEGSAYITEGTAHENGGVLNHLLTMLIYALVYSDFPLLLPLLLWEGSISFIRYLTADGSKMSPAPETFFFHMIVPSVTALFFVYNLFIKLLFFRTYTPYFGIAVLYIAVAAEQLYLHGGWKKLFIIVLTVFMVLRGSWLVYLLSDNRPDIDRLSAKITQSLDENWDTTFLLSMFHLDLSFDEKKDVAFHLETSLDQLIAHNDGSLEIQPGQLVITGAYNYHQGQPYLLPVDKESSVLIDQWLAFKEANKPWLLGQAYPTAYYYLLGGWLRGGTLSQYEFPCTMVYYRSQ